MTQSVINANIIQLLCIIIANQTTDKTGAVIWILLGMFISFLIIRKDFKSTTSIKSTTIKGKDIFVGRDGMDARKSTDGNIG